MRARFFERGDIIDGKTVGAAAGTSGVLTSETPGQPTGSCADTMSFGHPSLFAGSRVRADANLGFQPGKQRVGRSRGVGGRARHEGGPAANAPSSAARQDPTDRIGAEPTMLDVPPAIDLPKYGPKRLSEASIQSFSARTGQTRSDATRRTVTVRSALGQRCGGRGRRRSP